MSTHDERYVDCAEHGRAEAAFVCSHLVHGWSPSPLGFHQAEIDPNNREWGDLNGWCNECEAVRAAEGAWNDVSEKFAAIKLVCAGCFFAMRVIHDRSHVV